MSERYWYQDGFIVLCVIGIIGFLGYAYLEKPPANVVPQITGRINQPVFGAPSLEITVWHERTGVLRNGRITISTGGELVDTNSGLDSQSHSFESWEPNRDRAVTLTFPLKHFDVTQEIPISFELIASGISPYSFSDAWLGDSWKSNRSKGP